MLAARPTGVALAAFFATLLPAAFFAEPAAALLAAVLFFAAAFFAAGAGFFAAAFFARCERTSRAAWRSVRAADAWKTELPLSATALPSFLRGCGGELDLKRTDDVAGRAGTGEPFERQGMERDGQQRGADPERDDRQGEVHRGRPLVR